MHPSQVTSTFRASVLAKSVPSSGPSTSHVPRILAQATARTSRTRPGASGALLLWLWFGLPEWADIYHSDTLEQIDIAQLLMDKFSDVRLPFVCLLRNDASLTENVYAS